MTRAEKIRQGDDVFMADEFCNAMPGNDCNECRFKEKFTGRCTLLEWLHEEVEK